MIQLVLEHLHPSFNQNFPVHLFLGFGGLAALLIAFASFVVRFPISHPHPRRILTTFGVTAAVRGTRMKIKDLWIAYAKASCVARPAINQF